MLTATFHKVAKKENSTYRPTALEGFSLQVQLEVNDGDSSILSPSIRVVPPANEHIIDYNYIHIPDFRRYYYINNWTYNADGTWTASCMVDFLASWKLDIISSEGYVGRSESHWDPLIQDRFYASRNSPVTIRNVGPTEFIYTPQNGIIIIGVASGDTSANESGTLGAIQYYLLTMAQFKSLLYNLLGFYDGENIKERIWRIQEGEKFQADGWQSLNNPLEYVVSCRFYPGELFHNHGFPLEQIHMGGWKAGGNGGYRLTHLFTMWPWTQGTGYHTGVIPLSHISDVGNYTDMEYPTYAPYASYILQTPWGEFDLDPNIMSIILLNQQPALYWAMCINIVTGTATFVVRDKSFLNTEIMIPTQNDTCHELIRTEIQLGTDIPLMATFKDDKFTMNAGKSVIDSLFGLASSALNFLSSGQQLGMNQGSGFNTAGAMVQGLKSTVDLGYSIADACIGSQKSAVGMKLADVNATPVIDYMTVQQTRYPTVGQSPNMFGRPLKQRVQNLNDFSNYIQLDYSKFRAQYCTKFEQEKVIEALLKGIYLE